MVSSTWEPAHCGPREFRESLSHVKLPLANFRHPLLTQALRHTRSLIRHRSCPGPCAALASSALGHGSGLDRLPSVIIFVVQEPSLLFGQRDKSVRLVRVPQRLHELHQFRSAADPFASGSMTVERRQVGGDGDFEQRAQGSALDASSNVGGEPELRGKGGPRPTRSA